VTESPRPLLQVRDLVRHFPVRRGFLRRVVGSVRAVDGIDFEIHSGETLGLVGESGAGKSTTGRAILRLTEPTSGSVRFDGEELTTLNAEAMRRQRRHLQMVFQDPYASLNPRRTVGQAVREPLDLHDIGTPSERSTRVAELLESVGLGAGLATRYPHEFSGGQRQRIGIARALATSPRLVLLDEPISALDVSIQAQIVNLLDDLKRERGLTYLFIAHDLAMVRHVSDRVAVMYAGRIVEIGPAAQIFDEPSHHYTRALLAAAPDPSRALSDPSGPSARSSLQGEVPSLMNRPAGCSFHPRCPLATDRCRLDEPRPRPCGSTNQVLAACHYVPIP